MASMSEYPMRRLKPKNEKIRAIFSKLMTALKEGVKGIKEFFESKEFESLLFTSSDQQNELRILVTGKTGQGKSALINGILGDEIAREGASAEACTTQVEMYKKVINNVAIKVFDSPGLQDRKTNEDKYIQSMRDNCQELSLVLYCTKMTNTRLTDDDKNTMRKLTEAFTENFWNCAIFVLTFANKEDVSRRDSRDTDTEEEERKCFSNKKAKKELKKRRFINRLDIWKKNLQQFLVKDVGVNPNIAMGIPVVPTGDSKITFDVDNPLCLPDRDNWFLKFWEACCLRVKGKRLFLQLNSDRIIAEGEEEDVVAEELEREDQENDKEILVATEELVRTPLEEIEDPITAKVKGEIAMPKAQLRPQVKPRSRPVSSGLHLEQDLHFQHLTTKELGNPSTLPKSSTLPKPPSTLPKPSTLPRPAVRPRKNAPAIPLKPAPPPRPRAQSALHRLETLPSPPPVASPRNRPLPTKSQNAPPIVPRKKRPKVQPDGQLILANHSIPMSDQLAKDIFVESIRPDIGDEDAKKLTTALDSCPSISKKMMQPFRRFRKS